MKKLKNLYSLCRKSNSSFLIVLLKYMYYAAKGKQIVSHQNAIIKGAHNISTKGVLKVGVDYIGFIHNRDVTLLNINGPFDVQGDLSIGRGCRIDTGKDAVVTVGHGTYLNPFTIIIIMHRLEIGVKCAISWNCHFLDEDFHEMKYEGKKPLQDNAIRIGNNVWIGSNVSVYKGTTIPNGCVVAANSVVRGKFEEENVLIAGNPAKIIKRAISW